MRKSLKEMIDISFALKKKHSNDMSTLANSKSLSMEEEDSKNTSDMRRRVLYQAEMQTLSNSTSFMTEDVPGNADLKQFIHLVRQAIMPLCVMRDKVSDKA